MQLNNKNSKAAQFQEGFLGEYFGHLLEDTLNLNVEFNLTIS